MVANKLFGKHGYEVYGFKKVFVMVAGLLGFVLPLNDSAQIESRPGLQGFKVAQRQQ